MEAYELWQGDCLELMKNIKTGSVDMILCDPPYGTTACKWDTVLDLAVLWGQYERVIKPNGAIVIFGSEPFSSTLRMSRLKLYRYDWIWDKVKPSGGLTAKYQPLKSHETISVFYKQAPNYSPQMEEGKKWHRGGNCRASAHIGRSDIFRKAPQDTGWKYPKSIIRVSNADNTNKVHPTQKPVELLEYLIRTYTSEGDTVLDNTMGAGSTGVACKNTGRRFIGIEKDPKYFEIAKTRIFTELPLFQKQVKL